MANGWTNEETFKFIELYQSSPEIWNPKQKHHKDKVKVNNAWKRMSEEMKVTVTELKRKKETLLAAYRLNHRKVLASYQAGDDEVFKPPWIYYDALAAFMNNVYECKSTLMSKEDFCVLKEDSSDTKDDTDDPLDTKSQQLQESKISSQVSIPTHKRLGVPQKREDDDCDLYGRLLAKMLREFSEIDRLELRHEIDGLIIKKKRLLSNPSEADSQYVTDEPTHSIYSELSTDDFPTSPYIHESRAVYKPSSSKRASPALRESSLNK
ncbi:uncharacterized protein LOC128682527 [Plodia interpunctella]|uniref:uncharacterized protein LOC128682527 n=1 Tax=Plodia interpunctella TaxID=58824 RepID=UPI0023677ED9|nr:uncharacterized protein LOC128682527 [Plodia interpunctella]